MVALSELGLGLILLDDRGVVSNLSPAALRIMGEDLRIDLGRPRARRAAADAQWQGFIAAVRRTGAGPGGRFLMASRDCECPLVIDAVAMPAGGLLLLLRRPAAATGRSQVALANAFGLTGAETRVALAAALGKGGPVIAEDLDVSLSTVRTHLKAVFAKTGTRSQAHLAAILAPALVI
jgi:DNA-binding CsgD family transcriptional regulator